MTTRGAVVFAIIMNHGKGVITKEPRYLNEKLKACGMPVPEVILDDEGMPAFIAYAKKWGYNWDTDRDLGQPYDQFDSQTGEPLGGGK